MSWDSYRHMLEGLTSAREPIAHVVNVLRGMPAAPGIDPIVLAHLAKVDEVSALAAIGVLISSELGRWTVQVMNARGQPIGEFPSVGETPDVVQDAYGDDVEVEPRNMRIVFRPHPSLMIEA
jgi:hypothetical protein